ncbi:TfoX/Sxy family protein [Pseudacidovorax sp. RU35E]|uniref:TfoX/Sxy family protein n=1 Tax=Pseudacidovorax sp. RU35E TaxID=1907403 RepID=UPI000953E279|nr:TfoX/Sxy family protein [Pseudacidovorax sp. RU35E]SIQ08961.1 DNA transformation protein [Pseudacidovorax sp. RU35E]
MTQRPARPRSTGAPGRSPSLFVQSLHEVFSPLGRVEARRMFGGHGLYHQDVMLALVVRDTLYLKADAASQTEFDALGLPAFSYQREGRPATLTSFRQAPETIFDDTEQALHWGRLAYEAALRAHQAKPARARGRTPATSAAPRKTKR